MILVLHGCLLRFLSSDSRFASFWQPPYKEQLEHKRLQLQDFRWNTRREFYIEKRTSVFRGQIPAKPKWRLWLVIKNANFSFAWQFRFGKGFQLYAFIIYEVMLQNFHSTSHVLVVCYLFFWTVELTAEIQPETGEPDWRLWILPSLPIVRLICQLFKQLITSDKLTDKLCHGWVTNYRSRWRRNRPQSVLVRRVWCRQ